jgi:SOS-response transcriptional repressor LexA
MAMPEFIVENPDFIALAREILGRGAAVRFRAHGRSMAPLIRDGDILTVSPVHAEELKVGDVILHESGDRQAVAHRVIGRSREDGEVALTTCGDRTPAYPESVRGASVLGKVVQLERGRRRVRLDRGLWPAAGALWVRLLPLRLRLIGFARTRNSRR